MEQDGEVLLKVPEKDLAELLLNLIAMTGEVEHLRLERDQLQYKIDQNSDIRQRSVVAAHSTSREECLNHKEDLAMNQSKSTPFTSELRPKQETEKLSNERLLNLTDSGVASRSCPSPQLIQRNRSPGNFVTASDSTISTSNNSELKQRQDLESDQMSQTIDMTFLGGNPNKHLQSFNAGSEMQCQGERHPALTPNFQEDVFSSEMTGQSHKLYRATSSRQDDRTANKGKKEMKKTGSHESYFPTDPVNNRKFDLQRKIRKLSYTPMSTTSSVTAQGKEDNLMMTYLPQIASRDIMNQVTCELGRVRRENCCLKEKEKIMENQIQLLKEDLESLRTEQIRTKDMMFEERKAKDKDQSYLTHLKSQLRSTEKRSESLEKMLNDERKRFNRDEEYWKKQIAELQKQIKTQN